MKRVLVKVFSIALIVAMACSFLPLQRGEVQAVSGNIVISQVYGGGGNSGAVYTNDFIELFNRGTSAVSLAGWSLQYASATGTGAFGSSSTQLTELPDVLVQPGQYYLVQEAAGSTPVAPLPTPDLIDTTAINLSGTGGKVALVSQSASLGCNGYSTPCSPEQLALIIDLVGWGTANFYEGSAAAPATTNATAVLRNNGGCADTDQNNLDFAVGAPLPRNSAATLNPCVVEEQAPYVLSTSPADGAVEVLLDSNLVINFSEAVNVSEGWYDISCSSSGAHSAAVSGGPSSFTLDPDADFAFDETCTVSLSAAAITDQDSNDPPDAMEADLSFTFQTTADVCSQSFTPIFEVQGSGEISPLVGSEVTVQGVVVGDFQNNTVGDDGNLNGFYLQDPTGDADAATSDGVFIYYPGGAMDVATGDLVRLRGSVSEYNGMTEITASALWACGLADPISPTEVSLPVTAVNDFEKVEGMLVTFPQALVISEYFNFDRYNEIVLTSTRHLTPTALYEPGSPEYVAAAQAFLLDKITLDDGRTTQNPDPALHPNGAIFDLNNLFRGGDTLTNVTGVIDYSFDLYRVQPTQGADYTAVNPRPLNPPQVGGNIKVVSMNTLNFFTTLDTGSPVCGPLGNLDCRGANTIAEYNRQLNKLVAAISIMNPDVAGLIEIENSPTDATIEALVAALNNATAPGNYAYIPTGPIGTDAIRAALIYKPATVTPVGAFAILDSSVDARFFDTKNRPVLAQTFQKINGESFTVAVNHLKSKGSACDDVGDPDLGDGAGNCNIIRTLGAEALMDWLATDPTGSGNDNVLIVGDLNSYDKEDPIFAIREGADDVIGTDDDYLNLTFEFEGEEAYSYVFDGQIGYLDYALSPALSDKITGAGVWHVNADEPDLIDYDMSYKAAAQDMLYQPDQYRYADHDPVLIGLDLNSAPTVDAGGPYSVIEGAKVTLTAEGSDLEDTELTYAWDLDNNGSYETPGKSVEFNSAGISAPAVAMVSVQVTDSGGRSAVDNATVAILYKFSGFKQPVDNPPVLNTVTAGSVIPVKFRLNGNKGLDIFASGYPKVEALTCPVGAVKDAIETTYPSRLSMLVYDPVKQVYTYLWVTSKKWTGTCQTLVISFNDGTTVQANFKFR